MKLHFETGGESWSITCDPARAPRTLAALAGVLPLSLQMHTPKIAGNHIYWHAPFIAPVEGGLNVLNASPGAFIYWPVRQFLEITYAPLQAETATVTVLGQLDGPVAGIARLASALREGQGARLFTGTLSLAGGKPPTTTHETLPGVPLHIRAGRLALWKSCPEDIASLTHSRAIMHPAGPSLMADGEARALHETLWWLRERRGREDEGKLRFAAGLALNRAGQRLKDFCHFTTSAAILFHLEDAIHAAPADFAALLDEAILCAGRISAWIDLQIPWNGLNEGFRAALSDGTPANTRAAV